MSIGTDRVRLSFNPSVNSHVEDIKQAAANLIDMCLREIDAHPNHAEIIRLWSLAATHFEDAAMWALKAATHPNA